MKSQLCRSISAAGSHALARQVRARPVIPSATYTLPSDVRQENSLKCRLAPVELRSIFPVDRQVAFLLDLTPGNAFQFAVAGDMSSSRQHLSHETPGPIEYADQSLRRRELQQPSTNYARQNRVGRNDDLLGRSFVSFHVESKVLIAANFLVCLLRCFRLIVCFYQRGMRNQKI